MGKHVHYLDNLRAGAVWLSIFCAAVVNYTFLFRPYLPMPQPFGLNWHIFYCAAATAILPVVFFLSAYFGAASLRIHMLRPYAKAKWTRLGWPWLIGTLVLLPELLYISRQSWTQAAVSPVLSPFVSAPSWLVYFQSPFWYTGLLLLFHCALLAAKAWKHAIFQHVEARSPAPALLIALYVVQTGAALACACLSGLDTLNQTRSAVLYLAYTIVVCAVYFLLGVYAFKRRWFTAKGYVPSLSWLIPAALLSVLSVLLLDGVVDTSFITRTAAFPAYAFSIVSLPAFMALLALFAKWCDKETAATKLLAGMAYPLYFLSDTLLQNTAYFLQPLSVSAGLKLILVLALSLIYGYMLCKYALWHLPSFKK